MFFSRDLPARPKGGVVDCLAQLGDNSNWRFRQPLENRGEPPPPLVCPPEPWQMFLVETCQPDPRVGLLIASHSWETIPTGDFVSPSKTEGNHLRPWFVHRNHGRCF